MNRAVYLAVFLGLAAVSYGHAEDYYIYHDPEGKLVISNKKPPEGSKIIRQRDLPEFQEPVKAPPSRPTEIPSKQTDRK